jgi:hypothetical protein
MAKKDMEIEMEAMPVDNVGIMQGFLEMMNEDDDEFEEDDEYEAGEMLGRTPDSPEILMNNLRGDMRSIDARRDELADLVGYSAAAETPESVLAMLQPVLAQQGIGAMVPPGMGLPPGAAMPPQPSPVSPVGAPNMPNVPNVPNMPSDMMAPMQPMPAGGIGDMAPGAMPPGPPPLQMARGGVVQRFSEGNLVQKANFDSGGGDDADASEGQAALTADSSAPLDIDTLMKIYNASARRMPTLKDVYTEKQKTYSDVLGGNRGDLSKLGLLTSLAERGFAYAANVDPITGKPMSGSQLSRLAGAARGLPTEMMKTAAAQKAEDRGIKLAALTAAEATLTARQKSEYDIAKEKAKKAGNYGLGSGWQADRISYLNKFLPDYKEGKLPEEHKNLFENLAGTMLSVERFTNEKGEIVTRVSGVPEPIKNAIEKVTGKKMGGDAIGASSVGAAQAPGAVGTAKQTVSKPNYPTMVSLAGKATGPVKITAGLLERFGFGLFDDISEGTTQADAFISLANNRIVRGLAQNPKFPVTEMESIKKELDLLPGLLKSEGAYFNRSIGIDNVLSRIESQSFTSMYDRNLAVDERNAAAAVNRNVKDARDLLGVIHTPLIRNNEEAKALFPQLELGDMYRRMQPDGSIVGRRKEREVR